MIEAKKYYNCTVCGNQFTFEDVQMCESEDCFNYVCPDCDGEYCESCKEIMEDGGESE